MRGLGQAEATSGDNQRLRCVSVEAGSQQGLEEGGVEAVFFDCCFQGFESLLDVAADGVGQIADRWSSRFDGVDKILAVVPALDQRDVVGAELLLEQ